MRNLWRKRWWGGNKDGDGDGTRAVGLEVEPSDRTPISLLRSGTSGPIRSLPTAHHLLRLTWSKVGLDGKPCCCREDCVSFQEKSQPHHWPPSSPRNDDLNARRDRESVFTSWRFRTGGGRHKSCVEGVLEGWVCRLPGRHPRRWMQTPITAVRGQLTLRV